MLRRSRRRQVIVQSPVADRAVALAVGLPPIPERLLLAHSRGQVLFVVGAGASMPSLPNFRGLVLQVYEQLDPPLYAQLHAIPRTACNQWPVDFPNLRPDQLAEARRFLAGDYDVVLGMLERRIDTNPAAASQVRSLVQRLLRDGAASPNEMHRALIRLSNRGAATTVVTTNFDLLLERAGARQRINVATHALGGIPRPSRSADFAGVMHIHGALTGEGLGAPDLVVSDRDFGEYYLRRRTVPDFIYDAARLFHLVLVGYSANDPPMRYLLNAVAADGGRFDDLKERFSFVGGERLDPVSVEDWRARGITPIHYDAPGDDHGALRSALTRWAELSAITGDQAIVDRTVRRIVRTTRGSASDSDRDLFDHLFRRGDLNERQRLTSIAQVAGADLDWLDAMLAIQKEPVEGGAR